MNFLARVPALIALSVAVAISVPAQPATPRETLLKAAFQTREKAQALALIGEALDEANAILARDPGNREAKLQQTLAIGYRGQLKRSPGDAKATFQNLSALAAADPRDPEAQVAVAGWHLTAVSDLGNFLARTLLGANRDKGFAALDRAIALGGNHAFYPGYGALIRIRVDSGDTATALALARRSAAAAATTPLDRIMQRSSGRILPMLQSGDGAGAARLARQLLPFGMLG